MAWIFSIQIGLGHTREGSTPTLHYIITLAEI